MKILRKLSPATINDAAFMKSLQTIDAEIFVCRIVGTARGYSVGNSQYGDYIKFTGQFAGFDSAGGESRAPACFLVGPADEMLKLELDKLPDGPKAIEFAFDLFAVPDKKEGSKGYQYRVATLTDSKEADPLGAQLASLPKLALAAPKAADVQDGSGKGDSETPETAEGSGKSGKK